MRVPTPNGGSLDVRPNLDRMAVVEGTEVSPVPWLTPRDYAEVLDRALHGDAEALHSLFFGPPAD